jgi:FtsH-binding integral membrane protein
MNQILDDYSFDTAEKAAAAKKFFAKVYGFMFFALIVSGAIAYQYGTIEFIGKYFIQITEKGASLTPLFYVVIFSPIGVALLLQSMVNRLNFPLMFALFALYSVLIGFSLSTIFIVYSMSSIAMTFGITAGTFGVMAIMGYTTSLDLTKMGSILYMAFIGIFIAGIVNFFMNSDTLGYIISIIGVIVFTGLTAYHMQQLKQYAHDSSLSETEKNKMALLGGFTLYVLFVNLFLSLLRLFGSRD